MATTSIDYKHPYVALKWEHFPSGGDWQDATNLSGYVGGQGTKTLEISSATGAETGYLRCEIMIPDGRIRRSELAELTATAEAPNITVPISDETPYESESATFGPIAVTGSPTPTLLWEAETADGNNTWADADTVFGADGSGQGTDTYVIANTVPEDNRDVRVTATNTHDSDVSQAALTVTPTLAFVGAEPTDKTITATGTPEYLKDFAADKTIGDWTFTRTSEATAPDESGVIQTYASGQPAWYRDQGLQLEDEGTNVITTQDLSSATWIKAGGAVVEGTDTFSSGATNGRVYHSGYDVTALHTFTNTITYVEDEVSPGADIVVEFSGGNSGVWPQFTFVENETRRQPYTANERWVFPTIRLPAGFTKISANYIQLEANGFDTSYIDPVGGTATTRTATSCSASFTDLGAPLPAGGFTNDFCGQVVFTLPFDFEESSGTSNRHFVLTDDTTGIVAIDTAMIRFAGPNAFAFEVVKGGVQETILYVTPPEHGPGTTYDCRFRYESGNNYFNVNGVIARNTAVVDTLDPPLTHAYIGGEHALTKVNMVERAIRIVPEALSDEDIEAWT